MVKSDDIIIVQTKKWIRDVVVGCNFCPFAAKEMKKDAISYKVVGSKERKAALEALASAFDEMEHNKEISTTLIILPEGVGNFSAYLQLFDMAEVLLKKEGYTGIYQLASFHPDYLFAGAGKNDPENYTNRSPYPMLHILKEESVSKAVDTYPGTENIPEKNIAFAKAKGLAQMIALRNSCL
ncbi:MAG: DUF1415 domain-containing protein [Ferruginibacter sp.]